MFKYVTIKKDNNYYRLLRIEQSSGDKSIYIKQVYFADSKSSYHSNYGKGVPPYRVHKYGCDGRLISESIEERQKFEINQRCLFNEFPKNAIITSLSDKDIVLDIDDMNFHNYEVLLMPQNRSDLLQGKYDNVVVAKIDLRNTYLIASCIGKKH